MWRWVTRKGGLTGCLAVLLVGASARPSEAGLIYTAPLETVVAASSHVALVRFDPQAGGFRAERWFRGTWRKGVLPLGRLPSALRLSPPDLRLRFKPMFDRRKPVDEPLDRLVLFMEAHHGRLHCTGYRRRGPGFGAHASIRLVLRDKRVFRYTQIMNPGAPVPIAAEQPAYPAFAKHLQALLAKHPYAAPPHPVKLPPLPEAERDMLLSLIGDDLDLYQGGWHTTYGGWHGHAPSRAGIEGLAERLAAFAGKHASKAAALHALDALALLTRKTAEGDGHRADVRRQALLAVQHVDAATARTWLLDELAHPSSGTDLLLLARLAAALGEDTYDRAIAQLVGWVERTDDGRSSGAYYALLELGHEGKAEAAARHRKKRRDGHAGK